MELQDLFVFVAGRCTRPAWEQLKDLSDNPMFESLLAELHNRPGTISEDDVHTVLSGLQAVRAADGSPRRTWLH